MNSLGTLQRISRSGDQGAKLATAAAVTAADCRRRSVSPDFGGRQRQPCYPTPHTQQQQQQPVAMGQLPSTLNATLAAWSESLSQLWLQFFPRWGDREYKIVMVGLDNAGKTTILYRLHLGEAVRTVPTIGSNVEQVKVSKHIT